MEFVDDDEKEDEFFDLYDNFDREPQYSESQAEAYGIAQKANQKNDKNLDETQELEAEQEKLYLEYQKQRALDVQTL